MLRASWASVLARKVRLFMSAAAVILGVAFVAGSLIFTDSLESAFLNVTASSAGDVVIRPVGAGDLENPTTATVPASLVAAAAAVPGAARADGNVTDSTTFAIGTNGKLVGGQGAPGIAVNHTGGPAAHGVTQSRLVQGRWPATADEVALDRATARTGGYRLGDKVRFVSAGTQATFTATLVGLHELASGGAMLGASVSVFDTATSQKLFLAGKNEFTDIWVTATPGTSQAELRAAVAKVLPSGFEAVTGDDVSNAIAGQIQKGLSFITTFLLVFAAVSLVVGAFLIVNTFSILIAQRSRELALFRAIGASRRQVSRSVLFEAFLVGLIGSTVGLGLGFVLAHLIRFLFGRVGLDLSGATMELHLRTMVAAYAVGLAVTMLAAYIPARRAGRVPPVAAMRDDAATQEGGMRRRVIVGVVLTVVGAGLMYAGLVVVHSNQLRWLGGGILGVLLGVALISPLAGRPLIVSAGWLYRRVFGVVGVMATENSLRNPRRTAATASALMIGVALVTLMSVFGASAKASIDRIIARDVTADFVVSNAIGQPFSAQVARKVEGVDGVGTVAVIRFAAVQRDGQRTYVQGVDPTRVLALTSVPTTAGRFADLVPGAVSVSKDEAATLKLAVGDPVTLTNHGQQVTLRVVSIHESGALVGGRFVVTLADLDALGAPPQDSMLYVKRAAGASQSAVLSRLDAVLSDNPVVTVKDQRAFADEQRKPIDQMLTIIYALLGLAVVIAILGIVNTLALSVIERTREIGLLRAVGLSRRQLRSMLRLESVIIALLGAGLGMGLGLAFGTAIQRSLVDEGFEVLAVPWFQLAVFLGLALVVGVLAALWPGRRAARVDILRAITTE